MMTKVHFIKCFVVEKKSNKFPSASYLYVSIDGYLIIAYIELINKPH